MLKNTSSHSAQDKNLSEWLYYLENLHSTEIDLGLERIQKVALSLGYDFSHAFDFAQVIIVAGTNGKGTTCAFLENALLLEHEPLVVENSTNNQAIVAVYSSPHIESFNERLRINKQDVTDQPFIDAFVRIEQARGEISLSYYEYTTLAAFLVLIAIKPKYIILEVGLGGRLDATNIVDADIAVITTIDIDHQAFLGDTRELIGFEKAGVMRNQQIVVVGDTLSPKSVLEHGKQINSLLKVRNQDFAIINNDNDNHEADWSFTYTALDQRSLNIKHLVTPFIPKDNVATALTVLLNLGVQLNTDKVNRIIEKTRVAGRIELFSAQNTNNEMSAIARHCDVILDVAHNPQAANYLAEKIQLLSHQYTRVLAVVGMLKDKDITNALLPMLPIVHAWYLAELDAPRTASIELLVEKLSSQKQVVENINCFDNITQAFKIANQQAKTTDLILVFGSFFTVAEVRRLLVNA